MEPETTETVAQTTDNNFASSFDACGACKESYEGKDPKLLPCLHTFCSPCITLFETGENNQLKCPMCQLECSKAEVVENRFIQKASNTHLGDKTQSSQEVKTCDGCEENTTATSYCNECTEWLCDQCVQAHRRVKVTKDHVIQPKDHVAENVATAEPPGPKLAHCPQHKNELLKLYCETCERLTCRDCQLSEHKDHRYQFIQEAAGQYKQTLQNLLGKIKEKSSYVQNAKALINKRNREICEKEKKVTNDIKMFAVKMITEVNKRGKQLLTDLQTICGSKKTQLGQKSKEIDSLSSSIEHAVKFAEFAVNSPDQTSMLYTKRTVIGQLRNILRTRCEVPNPYHVVDIRLQCDHNFVLNEIPKMGMIVMDGVPFLGGRSQTNMPSPVPTVSDSNHLPQQQRETSPSLGYTSPREGSYPPRDGTFLGTPHQHLTLRNLNPSQREMLFNRMRQMQEQKQNSGRGGVGAMSPPVLSVRPGFPTPSTQRLTPLPNQSSNISSSNHHQAIRSSNIYFPGSRLPKAATSHNPIQTMRGAMINLAQLQEKRMRRVGGEGVSTSSALAVSPNPIIIQPQQYSSSTTSPSGLSSSPLGLADCMQDQLASGGQLYNPHFSHCSPEDDNSYKPEDSDRPSCSFATIASIPVKIEPRAENEYGSLNLSSSSGSRTSTPHIESTNQELGTIDQPMDLDGDTTDDTLVDKNGVLNLSNKPVGVGGSREGSPFTSLPTVLEPPLVRQPVVPSTVDESEDYCGVCHNGGDLLCCDGCPKVFHLQCHVPTLTVEPSGSTTWYCGLCGDVNNLRLLTAEPRPENQSSKRRNTSGLTRKEAKVCNRVLLELLCHEATPPFHEPVPKDVPNYYKIISYPRDFGTIKRRLSKNSFSGYDSVEEFVGDCHLVVTNCATYNHAESEVGKAGIKVGTFLDELVSRFLPYVDLRAMTPGSDEGKPKPKRKKTKDDRKGVRGKEINSGKEETRQTERSSPFSNHGNLGDVVEGLRPVPELLSLDNSTLLQPSRLALDNGTPLQRSRLSLDNGTPFQSSRLSLDNGIPLQSSPLSLDNGTPLQSSSLSLDNGTPLQSSHLSLDNGTPLQTSPLSLDNSTPLQTSPQSLDNSTPLQINPLSLDNSTPLQINPLSLDNSTPLQTSPECLQLSPSTVGGTQSFNLSLLDSSVSSEESLEDREEEGPLDLVPARPKDREEEGPLDLVPARPKSSDSHHSHKSSDSRHSHKSLDSRKSPEDSQGQ